MTGQTTGSDVCQEAARLVRAGEFSEAIALYREELERDERSIAAHRGLAAASFLTGDYDAAIEHFTRVTRLDPRCGKSLINLGAAYNRLGKHDKAVETLRRGTQIEKSAEGFYNLGIAQRHLGQLAMAISAYREAIRRAPEMVEAYLNLANAYLEMGNHQQAITNYTKALEIRPEFEQARVGLEAAEQAVKKSRGAISPFGRLVGAQPAAASEQPSTAANAKWNDWTEQELMEHRQELRQLSYRVQAAGHEFCTHLKQQVEPRLAEVNRAVGEGKSAMHMLVEARADFHRALEEWVAMRTRLDIVMDELRAAK
ncbi:MAG: tetratricopeptide repeat protein [Planctomycetaceae bacterium]